MKKIFFLLILLFLSASALIGAALYDYSAPGTFSQEANVILKKGMRGREIGRALQTAGLVKNGDVFYAINVATGNARNFKAGEYAFAPGTSPREIAEKIIAGEVVVHKLTIPEGWNAQEVRAALEAEPVLEGALTLPLAEGSILPETYYFTYGETRGEVAARMQKAMSDALAEEWENRAEGLPLASMREALILASIVEKETGVEEERARVASVFINRLKIGMRLQTDPTVIYGIEQITGRKMTRPLNLADLETPSNYNTYLNAGLPPGPIANPGRDAIRAALNPMKTDDLYFVAIGDGSGAHRFAKTLEEHNRNVASYRENLKKMQ